MKNLKTLIALGLTTWQVALLAAENTNAVSSLPLPPWLATPAKEISTEMSVELTIPHNPYANTFIQVSMLLQCEGVVTRQGTRQYRAEESGAVILWTSSDSVAKPGQFSMFPWERDWLKGKELTEKNPIQDFSNFLVRKKDGTIIAFRGTRVLATCSNVLSYQDGGQTRRFVVVDYDFEVTKNDYQIGSDKPTFTSRKRVTWPYDSAFLTKVTESTKEGEALFQSAKYLLDRMQASAKKAETK